MKSVSKILVLLLSVCAVVSCSTVSEPEVNPGKVALMFFNSLNNGDAEVVRESVCFDNEVDEKIFDDYLERMFIPEADTLHHVTPDSVYVLFGERVIGDTAFVELRATSAFGKQVTVEVRLLKHDGDWKVDGSQAVLHRVE